MKLCRTQLKLIRLLAGTLFVSSSLWAATSPVGDVVGKVTVGYQGWFSCVGDGSPRTTRWIHWATNSSLSPRPGNTHFDLYPDVREYTTTYQTGYANLGNGSPAKLFSSYDPQVINKHVEWMKTYKIDTVALQRFGYDVFSSTNSKAFRDSVATKIKNASQTYGRKFYIMYDITSWTSFQTQIKQDWTNTITGSLGLTNSSAYAKQNGKPVVCIWGVGKEIGSSTSWTDVINYFKGKNCYVIIGIPREWRTDDTSSSYQYANMLSPWTIGAYETDSEIDSHGRRMRDDKVLCDSRGQDYQPVVWPGFSWYNWKPGATKNDIPRRHGDFMWRQFYNVRSNNIPSVYVAMFDEYDEGTAIMKAAENTSMKPTNQWFLTLDYDGTKCSSDFYLRLTGDGGDMVKSNRTMVKAHPTPHTGATVPPYCHIDIPTGSVTKNLGDTLPVTVSATDSDGVERVKIFLSGVEQMSDSSSPYEFSLSLTNAGTFTLTAQVKDNLGNYTASDNSRTITVNGGTTTTTVPWVTNQTLAVAGTAITNAGLVVGTVSSGYSSTVAIGKIFSQTPGGGTTVTLGSSVNLAVSLGPTPTTGTTVTFTSVGAHDGYVDESSETSNVGGAMAATLTTGTAIRVGDTGARKQRKGFVSFNTASLPDTAVVTSATLKLKRGGILGTPTSLGAITVDIKNTSIGFGTTEALEIIDFQAAASKSNVGTLSYPTANDTWAIASLNADGIARINLTDHTQFRVRFVTDDDNDVADDYLGFYSGENATAANRPVLEVTYQ